MKRRGLLVALGGVLASAGCTDTARPSGPRTPPRSPKPTEPPTNGLVITDFVDEKSDDGTLLVRVTVENRAGTPQSGTVVAQVRAGDQRNTVSQSVTVEASTQTEVTLSTEFEYETFLDDGSIRVDIQ